MATSGFRHTLRALRHSNYRIFFAGQSLSLIGTWTQQIAMSWLVYRLTGSAFLLGLTAFAAQIPILLFAPFGGLCSDLFDRRKMMVVTQSAALVQAVAMAIVAYMDATTATQVILMAGLLGTILALETPARQSFTSELVPERADLPSAIAINAMMQNGGRMIGPTVAGILLAHTSEAFCFLLNSASKIAGIAALVKVRVTAREIAPRKGNIWQGLREGAVYGWSLRPIRWLLGTVALVSFTVTPYQALAPIYAAEVFHGDARTLGYLMGAAGIGAVCGLVYLASRRGIRGLTRLTAIGTSTASMSIMIFSYSTLLPLSLLMMAGVGFGIITTAMTTSTIIQTVVEDRMRGRLMSFFTMAFLGVVPLGSFAAGYVAENFGPAPTLFAGGAICACGAAALWTRMKILRSDMGTIYDRLGIELRNDAAPA